MAVIAFVGSFGSGCTALSEFLMKGHKYSRISLDTVIRGDYFKATGKKPSSRIALYDFADEQRMRFGTDYYAKMAFDSFKGSSANLIINDMKHVDEILYAKRKFPKIIIFGILTEREHRWERLKESYKDDKNAFDRDDKREQGINDASPYRQSMNKSFAKSNVIIRNQSSIIAAGHPHTESLMSVLLEKIAHYSKHPPSESAPEIVDMAVTTREWKWNFGPLQIIAVSMSIAALIGGVVVGIVGYAISSRNAMALTTFTHIDIGAAVGAILCLVCLIVYGELLKRRKSKKTEEDTEEDAEETSPKTRGGSKTQVGFTTKPR